MSHASHTGGVRVSASGCSGLGNLKDGVLYGAKYC